MTDNDAERNFQLGVSYESKKDYKKAYEYYKLSADQGVSQDFKKAIEYYMLSMEQGNKVAYFHLGLCYEKMKKSN